MSTNLRSSVDIGAGIAVGTRTLSWVGERGVLVALTQCWSVVGSAVGEAGTHP